VPLAFGEPDALPVALVPAKTGAIALWRGGDRSADAESRALHATHLTPKGIDRAMYGRIVAMNGYAAASNGSELLVTEPTSAIKEAAMGSDGAHWIYFGQYNEPLHVVRTALDGSQREETTFENHYNYPHLACAAGACLLMWSNDQGELWSALLRADRPLASAHAERFVTSGPVQHAAIGAAPGAFIIVTARMDGSARAAIVSARSGAVERELTVAVFRPRYVPYAHAGGGADGFEVAFEGTPMQAYRVGFDGSVRPLGAIGTGSPRGIVRNGGRGYVLYDRRGDVFATITE